MVRDKYKIFRNEHKSKKDPPTDHKKFENEENNLKSILKKTFKNTNQ